MMNLTKTIKMAREAIEKERYMTNELTKLEKRFIDDVCALAKEYDEKLETLLVIVAHTLFDMCVEMDMNRYDPESGELKLRSEE